MQAKYFAGSNSGSPTFLSLNLPSLVVIKAGFLIVSAVVIYSFSISQSETSLRDATSQSCIFLLSVVVCIAVKGLAADKELILDVESVCREGTV